MSNFDNKNVNTKNILTHLSQLQYTLLVIRLYGCIKQKCTLKIKYRMKMYTFNFYLKI